MDDRSVLQSQSFRNQRHHYQEASDAIREHPHHAQYPVPYPSISSSDLKVTTPLCIPLLLCSNNQPTHQWDMHHHHHHHHRAEGFRVPARRRGVGIDAMDYWSLGRFRGFGKLYAWFCRRLTDADMRLQTSLSMRRSPITVDLQSTACASTRSGYECYSNIRFRGSDQGRRARTAHFAKWGDSGGSE